MIDIDTCENNSLDIESFLELDFTINEMYPIIKLARDDIYKVELKAKRTDLKNAYVKISLAVQLDRTDKQTPVYYRGDFGLAISYDGPDLYEQGSQDFSPFDDPERFDSIIKEIIHKAMLSNQIKKTHWYQNKKLAG